MKNLYEILEKLKIPYSEIEHEKVCTVEQAQRIKSRIDGVGCKNLFLTDKKGKYILAILKDSKKADMKKLARISAAGRLSFAGDAELKNILNLERGSVTPLGIINDTERKVTILIDRELESEKLLLHPDRNTKTISMQCGDLIKFIEYEKHGYIFMEA